MFLTCYINALFCLYLNRTGIDYFPIVLLEQFLYRNNDYSLFFLSTNNQCNLLKEDQEHSLMIQFLLEYASMAFWQELF